MLQYAGSDLRTRCNLAIQTLQRARVGMGTGAREKFSFLQNRKRTGLPTMLTPKVWKFKSWTHPFVCLHQRHQETIPTTESTKDTLLEASLGEKKITIPDVNASAEEFRAVLLDAFPKLQDAGGFCFAKCRSNSRCLEPQPSLCLTSPRILQDHVGNARTYILPMQKDLDISAVSSPTSGVSLCFE